MNMATVVVVVLLLLVVAGLVGVYVFRMRGDARFRFDIGGQTPKASGGNDPSAEGTSRTRIAGLGLFSGGIIAVLLAKLWSMQLLEADSYAKQADSNRTRTIKVAAPRGRILDRNGTEIVTNRASLTVVASSDVADDGICCQLLGNLIGMPATAVKRNIQDTTEGVQSARTVAVDVSRRVVAYIGAHPGVFDGVSVEERSVRAYPMGTLACHLVGYTGTVTTDQLEASEDSEESGGVEYQSGDTVGQAGVEYQYESVLQGVHGEQNVFVDADGNVLDYSSSVPAVSGSDVVLTIDANVQQAAEQSMSEIIAKLKRAVSTDCETGAVVAMDVTNGEILAMASAPTYSPNLFVGGISNADWTDLQSDESQNPLMNRVISAQYPSGSTIKPLSAFAALENGVATPDTHYWCSGWWTGLGSGAGQWCWKHSGHGDMTLETGITYSCDVVFYEIGKAFWTNDLPEGMQDTFREWGLGSLTNIDLPGEGQGRVPDAEWKYNYYSNYSDEDREWKAGDYTNLAIGQGDLLVTPLQMACAYAGIATGGTIWTPHVLKCVKSATGTGSVIDYEPSVLRSVEVNDDYRALIVRGMEGVITTESESQAEHFASMKETVAGKTGTAERANQNPTGWFAAFAPADDPKYVVCCAMENSSWGSVTAFYVVRDVLGSLFDEPDDIDAVVTDIGLGYTE